MMMLMILMEIMVIIVMMMMLGQDLPIQSSITLVDGIEDGAPVVKG